MLGLGLGVVDVVVVLVVVAVLVVKEFYPHWIMNSCYDVDGATGDVLPMVGRVTLKLYHLISSTKVENVVPASSTLSINIVHRYFESAGTLPTIASTAPRQ